MLKAVLLCGAAVLLGAVLGTLWWFHTRVPPNCRDPRTIALVRQGLIAHDHLPATVTVDDIRTIAGGPVAMRFVCQASVNGFDSHQLPAGTPVPALVDYTSALTPDRRRHVVSVDVEPILRWEKVQ